MQLKNSVSKGDKKKKKEINAEIAKLEGDMNERHSTELMDLMLNAVTIGETEDVKEEKETREESKIETEVKEVRVSKAQKRRDKKVEKAKQRVAEIEAQDEANLEGARHLEQARIFSLTEFVIQFVFRRGLRGCWRQEGWWGGRCPLTVTACSPPWRTSWARRGRPPRWRSCAGAPARSSGGAGRPTGPSSPTQGLAIKQTNKKQ